MKKKIIFGTAGAILFLVALGFVFRDQLTPLFLGPTSSPIPEGVGTAEGNKVTPLATRLDTPWAIEFLPSDDILVTERPGRLRRIASDGQTFEIQGVRETSEGGLLGVALHPDFESNSFIYLYSTYQSGDDLRNRVERYVLNDDRLNMDKVIIENIPGANTHDGGVVVFGPDNKLYVTTGDANNPESAQDTSALSGKILRLNEDGTIPEDNPFRNPVYSYGHRNPQGITWDDKGRLWSTEHGPSGVASGRDEINLIESGANYGWPVITGNESREGMRSPVAQSGDDDTWAPGGVAFVKGSLFFSGLRGQSLYQATIREEPGGPTVTLQRHFTEDYGRLRAVSTRHDSLFVSTSNTDGRGNPSNQDDRILRIPATVFFE